MRALFFHAAGWSLAMFCTALIVAPNCTRPPRGAPPSEPVGSVSGHLAVGNAGEALYTIPLRLPPGVGAAQPKLSLTYSSQGGDGLIGKGFRLGGLSTIARCPANPALEGYVGTINYNSADKYCLDGQRLIPIGNGQYRTEVEQYSRIIANGSAGTGPASWEVTTRDGTRYEYGRGQAVVVAEGLDGGRAGTRRAWPMNRVEDLSGNYYTVQYDVEDNGFRPRSINYSENDAANIENTHLIAFSYQQRPAEDSAASRRFVGDMETSHPVRLVTIDVSSRTGSGSNFDRHTRYRLGYDLSELGHSRVTSIEECASAQGVDTCKPATRFTWEDGDGGIGTVPGVVGDDLLFLNRRDWRNNEFYPGDYDGDGTTDIYRVSNSQQRVCLGSTLASGGTCQGTFGNKNWRTRAKIRTGDFDGDGRTDFLLLKTNTGNTKFCSAERLMAGNGECATFEAGLNVSDNFYVGDFDGDSRSDALVIEDNAQKFCPADAITGSGGCRVIGNAFGWKSDFEFHPGDFNGDGVVDVYAIGETATMFCDGQLLSAIGVGTCVAGNPDGDWSEYKTIVGDFNGDGQEDLYQIGSQSTRFCAGPGIAKGNNCIDTAPSSDNWKDNYDWYSGDFNGDLIADLVRVSDTRAEFCAGPWVQSDVAQCTTILSDVGLRDATASMIPGDFDGNGVPDMLVMKPDVRIVDSTWECEEESYTGTAVKAFTVEHDGQLGAWGTVRIPNVPLHLVGGGPDANHVCNYEGQTGERTRTFGTQSLAGTGTSRVSQCPPGGLEEELACPLVGWPAHTMQSDGDHIYSRTETANGVVWNVEQIANVLGDVRLSSATCGCSISGPNILCLDYNLTCTWVDGADGFTATVDSGTVTAALSAVEDPGSVTFRHEISIAFGRRGAADLVTSVTDGLGNETEIAYAPLSNTDGVVYTKRTDAVHPQRDVQGPIYVVKEVTHPTSATHDVAPDSFVMSYAYEGLKTDLDRRRSLGFAKITTTDSRTGHRQERTFNQYGLLAGTVSHDATYAGGDTLRETYVVWDMHTSDACDTCGRPYPSITVNNQNEINGEPALTTVDRQFNLDAFGNPGLTIRQWRNSAENISNEYVLEIETQYDNDTNDWVLGRPTRTVATATNAAGSIETTSTFQYDAQHRLQSTTQFVGVPGAELTTTYERGDPRGLVTRATASSVNPSGADRFSVTRYDDAGFPYERENALGHVEQMTFDWGLGVLKERIDPNGVTVTRTYDGFGRPRLSSVEGQAEVSVSYQGCDSDCRLPEAITKRVLEVEGINSVTEYLDGFGRAIATDTTNAAGDRVQTETTYDEHGLMRSETPPHFVGDPSYQTTYRYDDLGRVTAIDRPNFDHMYVVYTPLGTVTGRWEPVPHEPDQETHRRFDSRGNLVEVTDSLGGVAVYTHDAAGNTRSITDPGSFTTTMAYDGAGRRVALNDPSIGEWTFDYNAFGQETRRESPTSGRVITTNYDVLGRVQTETGAYDGRTDAWTWNYDTASHGGGGSGLGLLSSVVGADYLQQLSYDEHSRVTNVSVTHAGSAYARTTEYDFAGRVFRQRYPGLSVLFDYASDGTVEELRGGIGASTPNVLWRALERDALGRTTRSSHGANRINMFEFDRGGTLKSQDHGSLLRLDYEWDKADNLRRRIERRAPSSHGTPREIDYDFRYDALNRLTLERDHEDWIVGPRQTYRYNARGDLTCLGGTSSTCDNGVQIYYGSIFTGETRPRPTTAHQSHDQTYGRNSAGEAGDFTVSFAYDENGNMVVRTPYLDGTSALRTIDYNAWSKPLEIRSGSVETNYAYGPDQSLLERTHDGPSAEIRVVRPFGNFERWTVNGANDNRISLVAPDGTGIVYKAPIGSGFTRANLRYTLTDQIGSPLIVHNNAGTVLEEYSFDPFGRQRLVGSNLLVTPPRVDDMESDQGFTGQTREPDHNLFNYGARIYDPSIGRFLQPDPIVQAPDDTRSLNRYSYVFNNPLKNVDPTGNVTISRFDAATIVHAIAGAVAWGPGSVTNDGYFVPDSFDSIDAHVATTNEASLFPNLDGLQYTVTFTTFRPSQVPAASVNVTTSSETTFLPDGQQNFNAYVDAIPDRGGQLEFLDAYADGGGDSGILAGNYYAEAANVSGATGALCSIACGIGASGAAAASATANLAQWERLTPLTNGRSEVGIAGKLSLGPVGLSARLGGTIGSENGVFTLRGGGVLSPDLSTAGGSLDVIKNGDLKLYAGFRWDPRGSTTENASFGLPGVGSLQVRFNNEGIWGFRLERGKKAPSNASLGLSQQALSFSGAWQPGN